MAAVLACGEGAMLSHRSAAELWQAARSASPGWFRFPCRPRLDAIVVREFGFIAAHRSTPSLRRWRHGIPVTTPAQTIADLEGTVAPALLRRAIRQAEVRGLRTGVEAGEPTRSELEHLFLRLCERHRIPAPEVNVRVGNHEVDFLWRRQRLIAETDGYRYHRGSAAFEDDHARDLDLRGNGFALHRFTYRQVTTEPARVAASITRALAPTLK